MPNAKDQTLFCFCRRAEAVACSLDSIRNSCDVFLPWVDVVLHNIHSQSLFFCSFRSVRLLPLSQQDLMVEKSLEDPGVCAPLCEHLWLVLSCPVFHFRCCNGVKAVPLSDTLLSVDFLTKRAWTVRSQRTDDHH